MRVALTYRRPAPPHGIAPLPRPGNRSIASFGDRTATLRRRKRLPASKFPEDYCVFG